MKSKRRSALILIIAIFAAGLFATTSYAQPGRHWHGDRGRHLGWYKKNGGRHLGWYRDRGRDSSAYDRANRRRSGRYYSAYGHPRRSSRYRSTSYGTYHIYRPGQRRSKMSSTLDVIRRYERRH